MQTCHLSLRAVLHGQASQLTYLPTHPPSPPHSPAGGALSADTAKNAACFGEGVSSKAILSGSVAPPPQLQPLYGRLSELASN